MEGWIRLSRKMLDWEWFDDSRMVKLWIYILLSCNYEDKPWHDITVQKGQLVTSYGSLSLELSKNKRKPEFSIKMVRTCLERLKSAHQVAIKTANKYTLITVVNWDKYQFEDEKRASKTAGCWAIKGQSKGNQRATTKEYKEYKEEEEKKEYISKDIYKKESAESSSTHFLPPSLEQIKSYISENGYKTDAEAFYSFYESKGWFVGKNKMKNWKAALVTWEKREKDGGKEKSVELNNWNNYDNNRRFERF